jgi:succinyl-CoA synthetase beta subunit
MMPPDVKEWLSELLVSEHPDEYEVKTMLSHRGILVPRGLRLMPGEILPRLQIAPPLAAKVCSGEILHKTERRGVILGIQHAELAQTIDRLRNDFPGYPVLIEEQVVYEGPEFIVGALLDPSFGLAVMVGVGGILTELYKDVTFRLAPCSHQEALRMIHELSVAPVFEGFRGLRFDASGLAEIISRVGGFAAGMQNRFSQLDINPLVYGKSGWIALDAKMVLSENSGSDELPSCG